MSKSTIFWGTFLILIGTLLLINKYNTIDSDFTVFISLWPVFLIFWGLSIIKFPLIMRNILTFLSAVFLALFIFAVVTNGLRITKEHIFHWKYIHHKSEKLTEKKKNIVKLFDSNVSSVYLKINFAAGELNLTGSNKKEFKIESSDFDFDETITPGNPDRVELKISSIEGHIINGLSSDRDMNLILPQYLDWFLDINIGAADANLNFVNLKIPSIKIDCGATDLTLKLGDKKKIQEVDINCGASDINVKIPKQSGCRIVSNTFLSDENFPGFSENNGVWISDNYSTAQNKIEINIDGGVSDFNVIKY